MAGTSFPDFITTRRRELDLTLGDVANGLGVSPITVSNWSNGQAKPDPDQLSALADLLDVPTEKLASMAGVSVIPPEPAVNLMPSTTEPAAVEQAAEDAGLDSGESTGPIAMLRTTDEEPRATTVPAAAPPSPDLPSDDADAIDSELAELIEEATAEEQPAPAAPQSRASTQAPARRRAIRRRRDPAADRPVTALPLTYVEDPKQLTRYRIRWALTTVVLVVMFFILLWASGELLSALSEVKQAVTPGGIGS